MDTITFDNPTFEVTSGHKIGDITNEIEMKSNIKVSALAMDRKAIIESLTTTFRDKLLQGTNKELAIHPDTLHMTNVVSRNQENTEMKITFEMNTSTIYDFENASNENIRQLKIKIAGMSEKETQDALINEGQATEVNIKNYPFWFAGVSNNPDSIEFVIRNNN